MADEPRNGFTFEGTLRIDCHVKGVLPSGPGTLIVGKDGRCESDAFVGTARIEGIVQGDIHASQAIELAGAAQVIGKMEAPCISIGPDAVFEGECNLIESAAAAARAEVVSVPPDNIHVRTLAYVVDSEPETLSLATAAAG